jgi:hypothetical protein
MFNWFSGAVAASVPNAFTCFALIVLPPSAAVAVAVSILINF